MTVWHIALAYGVGFLSGVSVILFWLFAASVPEEQAQNTPPISELVQKGVPVFRWGKQSVVGRDHRPVNLGARFS
jgi:hypothetical protein